MNVNRQQQDKLAKEKRMLKKQLFQLEKYLKKVVANSLIRIIKVSNKACPMQFAAEGV
ncbi:hypothetical protein IGL76_000313 [Enterococcus sp. DIV2381]